MDLLNTAPYYRVLTPDTVRSQTGTTPPERYPGKSEISATARQAEYIPAYPDETDLAQAYEQQQDSASARPEIRSFLQTQSAADSRSGRFVDVMA